MNTIKRIAPGMRGALLYGYLEWISASLWLCLPSWLLAGKQGMQAIWRTERRTILLAAGLTFFTYMLILWAYTTAQKVAYVAALRQFSIVLGSSGRHLLFREPGSWGRVARLDS